jgi:hypothetical protein
MSAAALVLTISYSPIVGTKTLVSDRVAERQIITPVGANVERPIPTAQPSLQNAPAAPSATPSLNPAPSFSDRFGEGQKPGASAKNAPPPTAAAQPNLQNPPKTPSLVSAANPYPALPGQCCASEVSPPAPNPGPKVALAQSTSRKEQEEAACRDKLASRGVYLNAGDPCVDIDTLIGKLATGNYRFNKPQSAYVEEPFRLVLTLETAQGQDVSSPYKGTKGDIVTRPAPFAQHVQATLRGGTDFKVEPAGAQERTATAASPVIWEWMVTPLTSGKKAIVIEVDADLLLPSRKEHVQLRTLYEEIQINVGFMHLFVSAFAGLWGAALSLATMIIALLGVIHYWRQGPKQQHEQQHAEEGPPVELVTHSLHQSNDHLHQ